ncbi:MAG: DEAD/DEAH box helicase [Clostridiaceae bacterium]|nr:DEAD/DEAH box helicase [Clostridiaceae bacterium]
MFYIDEKTIIEIVNNSDIYNKGFKYYLNNKVMMLKPDHSFRNFRAKVAGTHIYHVEVSFNLYGEVVDKECTCAAYDRYWGYCKHIVAVLLDIHNKDKQGKFQHSDKKNQAKGILEYFRNQQFNQYNEKKDVQLEITYELEKEFYKDSLGTSYLTLRIGQERLYVVRSMRDFMEKIYYKKTIDFGKNFTFDPIEHKFNEENQKIIDLIQEVYEHEDNLSSGFYSKKRDSLFKGKRVQLTKKMLKRFLEIVGKEYFSKKGVLKANIFGQEYTKIDIYQENFPIEFQLHQRREDVYLKVSHKGTLIPLVADGEYFFTDKGICRVEEETRKNFLPFYQILSKEQGSQIMIPKKEQEVFLSEVYPIMKELGSVKIDEKLENIMDTSAISPEVYLDKSGDTITADIHFIYGNTTIYPFHTKEREILKAEQILLRDTKRERQVISFFEDSDFKVKNDLIYLDDEEGIFQLIHKRLEKLQSLADIYYSEAFKSIEVKHSSSFKGGFNLNTEENLLEFHFDIEGIQESELKRLFHSLKEKKKYHRLKDGSFIPLEDKGLSDINDLMESLDLTGESFKDKVIKIPKFNGLYIEELIKEKNLDFIKKNKAFKKFVEDIKEFEDIEYEIPQELKNTLRNYQTIGFRWLKSLSHYGLGGILADDMGLGKTLQVLTYLLSEKQEKGEMPTLIVAPTSLVYNWLSEVEKFTPQLKVMVLTGNKDERRAKLENIKGYDIIVTSYPLIRRDDEFYENIHFRCCILDEAQHIKNPLSQNAKSVKTIKANQYFALTGTPIENSLTELWSIFDFIMPGYLLSHHRFRGRFEKPITMENDQRALLDLGRLIKPFILRRLKKNVLQELPEKIESKMVAELDQEQKKVYMAYLSKIKGEIEEEIQSQGFEKSHIKILAALTRLRQICCHPSLFIENYEGSSGKLELLQEIIENNIESGHRILLFSQFTSMLEMIRVMLNTMKLDYYYLHGATPMEERGHMVKQFNEGKGKVFLISLKAGGTGLNLTGADTVIHFDPWWNPAVEDQATDRAYRIGQKNKVHVMKLITKGTIEEKILKLQEKKRKIIEAVIHPGETFISKMNQEELMELFKVE